MIGQPDLVSNRFEKWASWHPHLLHIKGVDTEQRLRGAGLVDEASSEVAINAVLSEDVSAILQSIGLETNVVDAIQSAGVGDRIDHVGFRIHTPMDVYFELATDWARRRGRTLVGAKRFAPSAAFQKRIGTSAEMAQIWLEESDRQVEIELFDIHAPIQGVLDSFVEDAHGVLAADQTIPFPRDWLPFVVDDVCHYGIRLSRLADVHSTHSALVEISKTRDDLALRNQEVVVNLWHGSHHTKLVNVETGTEIEFLAYIEDWDE